ncbi:MAG: hypothetical protein MJZ51_06040 [Bacteroidales bacterium]|nr:hypothetical protein [Bacteroidales bacterium]
MKKIITCAVVATVALLAFSSCGKRCWCYQAVGNAITESEVYTDDYNSCNSLSTLSRTCVEDGERMDPSQIAFK